LEASVYFALSASFPRFLDGCQAGVVVRFTVATFAGGAPAKQLQHHGVRESFCLKIGICHLIEGRLGWVGCFRRPLLCL
jgi:hypothetical protein